MTTERPALDLSGILPSYSLWTKEPEEDTHEESSGPKYPTPVVLGSWKGPEVWSTCTDVAPIIVFKWDVNGYYRELGVHPDATRRELMQAYVACNGQESPRLTYCFKQLLNPKIRKEYDATPLGEPYLDEYTQDELRKAAARESVKRCTVGEYVTPAEVLDEWGYELNDGLEDAPTPPKPRRKNFEYKYYAWQTSEYLQDEERLAEWQSVLVSQAAQMGIKKKIAIGVTSLEAPGSFVIQKDSQGNPIIYLAENCEITEKMAKLALSRAVEW